MKPTNTIAKKIREAVETVKDDEYANIINLRYFENTTLEDISYMYDCSYRNISKRKNKLVRAIAAELFPEEIAQTYFK